MTFTVKCTNNRWWAKVQRKKKTPKNKQRNKQMVSKPLHMSTYPPIVRRWDRRAQLRQILPHHRERQRIRSLAKCWSCITPQRIPTSCKQGSKESTRFVIVNCMMGGQNIKWVLSSKPSTRSHSLDIGATDKFAWSTDYWVHHSWNQVDLKDKLCSSFVEFSSITWFKWIFIS